VIPGLPRSARAATLRREENGVKLGIVSDIHGNLPGLQRALDLMGDVDELLCLGDCIYDYQFSNEVVALLRRHEAHIIQGNHEEVFYSPAGVRARERAGIDPGLMGFLANQPPRRALEFGGMRVLMVHSTPWEPRGAYVYPHSAALARFAEADADVVLYGHTHAQVVRRVGRVLVVNPGSAGDARDHGNGRRLSCAVLDTASGEARVVDFDDPRFAGVS
jgi:putative phosphoesterase